MCVLKVKLGSPAGISADQAMLAVRGPHQRYMLMLMGVEFEGGDRNVQLAGICRCEVEQPPRAGGVY